MSTEWIQLPPAPKPRFNHLVASHRGASRSWSGRTLFLSTAAHAAILVAGVYLGVVAPEPAEKKPEVVTYFELKQPTPPTVEPRPVEKPRPQKPPPPKTPKQRETATLIDEPPPPPKGYQALVPPIDPPPIIPAPDPAAQIVSAVDFSGVGQAGGTSSGVSSGGTPTNVVPPDTTPVFEAEDTGVKTELRNHREIERLLQRTYPKRYAKAGVAGQVQLRFMIDEEGHVPPASIVVVVATNDEFAEAASKAAERFRFRPIRFRGQSVRVWAAMPVIFQMPK